MNAPQHVPKAPKAPDQSQESESLLKRLAGPSTTKAGLVERYCMAHLHVLIHMLRLQISQRSD